MSDELIAQLLNPEDASLSAGSNQPVRWRCLRDPRHVWTATPNTRSRSPHCSVCLGKVVIPGVNDLATTDPAIAAELTDPADGTHCHRGTSKKVSWTCITDPSHTWTASVTARVKLGSGCPVCSGRVPHVGVNDLTTTHPGLAATLVDPSEATTVGAGSGKKLLWRCTEDPSHTWKAEVRYRTGVARNGNPTGCPECLGRTPRSPKRHLSLAELNSPLLSEAVYPSEVGLLSKGSGKVVEWYCPDCNGGHTYLQSVRHRVRGQGCPVKTGAEILAGFNDLATTHPEIAAELVDASLATSLSRGSVTLVEWRCTSAHTWTTAPYARVAGNGCPDCCPIGSSYGEQEMFAAIQVLDPSATHRARVAVGGKNIEADVLCQDIAFEFNGVFWHREHDGRDSTSHAVKRQKLRSAGVSLVTVWQDDWDNLDRRAVIVRSFAHKLNRLAHLDQALAAAGLNIEPDPTISERIGARSLIAVELNGAQAAEFLRHNHVQGAVALTRSFGLIDDQGRVRALLGLRSPQHNARTKRDKGTWEIQRYATRGLIPGGFSKLLKHAEHTLLSEGQPLTCWISLSANELSDGQLYVAAGFSDDGQVRPSYWYAGGPLRGRRQPKEAFQLKRFRTDDSLIYEEGWSELQAATANKLYRVWDAGKTRWVKPVA